MKTSKTRRSPLPDNVSAELRSVVCAQVQQNLTHKEGNYSSQEMVASKFTWQQILDPATAQLRLEVLPIQVGTLNYILVAIGICY